jgi:hypothetical protein
MSSRWGIEKVKESVSSQQSILSKINLLFVLSVILISFQNPYVRLPLLCDR